MSPIYIRNINVTLPLHEALTCRCPCGVSLDQKRGEGMAIRGGLDSELSTGGGGGGYLLGVT